MWVGNGEFAKEKNRAACGLDPPRVNAIGAQTNVLQVLCRFFLGH